MKKSITIQEVANRAGVSKTTISRYLNGRYDNMSLKTKERINQIIEELDYRPSKQAQGLKLRKSSLIGLLIADIENLYSAYLIKATQDALSDTGYQMIIMNTNNSEEEEQKAIQKLLDQNVDGILLQPVSTCLDSFKMITDADIPTVLVDRSLDKSHWTVVQSDNFKVTKELTHEIANKGYEKIILVSEPIGNISPRVERYEGIKFGALSKDLLFEVIELSSKNKSNTIINYLKKESLNKKTAFFASNGNALYEIVVALNQLDIIFPRDCGVCGYDDWFWAELITPGITTIHQDPHRIGKRAVSILLEEMIEPQQSEKIEIAADIHLRKSL
ncbi:LacI family DNA-binding transcriptional regulator [Enterococcus dongliensis]|uniref:LacI family DNA-binding transcriptional regulator n=1 Tax=Enterococcus dongliensis TaxID=2559925 RepID=UPI002890E12E|nr:LacI family DNA-binding transcriptional regulator [Enterococcus dongliensis]MDT2613571.1 LacI family DNA-binding transcriptional regulator [Enterococcus dongliensis]